MLKFTREMFHSHIVLPNGESVDRPVEIRVHPITGRTCRITITQNHLPSAGGSLLHPHLQVQADQAPANFQRFLQQHAADYRRKFGLLLIEDGSDNLDLRVVLTVRSNYAATLPWHLW